MTPEQTLSALAAYGQTVTLRRPTGSGLFIAVDMPARIDDSQPTEMPGGIQQGDRKIIASPLPLERYGWQGHPRRGDQIIIDGRITTVQAVETLVIGGVVQRYHIQVRGG